MNAHVDKQQFVALLAGTIDLAKEAELFGHIDNCAVCQDTLADLASTQETFCAPKSFNNKLPAGYDLAFLEQIKQYPPSEQDCLHAFLNAPCRLGDLGQLGTYRIVRMIGEGGMGVVLEAEDTLLRRCVAIKVLKPQLIGDAVARQRFLREARSASAIDHEHIVTIFQVGEENGLPFLAMQYLNGESLAERLRRETHLKFPNVLRIGREIAEGLAAAHAHGLIHRDIKPSNIWLERDNGRVKLLDFGLVKQTSDKGKITRTDTVVGSVGYLAPEQAQGKNLDQRCDLFSLGCVLYEMSTGRLPFGGDDILAYLSALVSQDLLPPHCQNPALPESFSHLVIRLLEKNAENRLASATDVVEAIRNLERVPSKIAATQPELVWKRALRRRKWALFSITMLIMFGLIAFWFGPPMFRHEPANNAGAGAATAFFNVQTSFVKSFGSLGNETASGVAVDENGFAYVCGAFYGEIDCDPGPGKKLLRSSAGSRDIFLVKFSPEGQCLWVHAIGGKYDNDAGRGIALDRQGNIFVTGMFQGTVEFQRGNGKVELHSWGKSEGCFVAKYSPEGKLFWAKQLGGQHATCGEGIALDSAGNVCVTGYFRHEGDFDPGPHRYMLRSHSHNDFDVFVCKLDRNGAFVWAKSFGGEKNDVGHRLTLDQQANIYLTGEFRFRADFDPGPKEYNINVGGQESNVFVVKLNDKGEFVWAQSAASLFYALGTGIVATKNHVYIAGIFSGACDFNPRDRQFVLQCKGRHSCFLWKLDTQGNFVWAKALDSTPANKSVIGGLALDSADNCYLAGSFGGKLDFDPGLRQEFLQSKGDNDSFIAKLDRDGGFVWAKAIGSPLADGATSVAIDRKGAIWTTGEFRGKAALYPDIKARKLISRGESDVFLWKLIPSKSKKK